MELRHLRYFIAVADAGSLTVAAEQKLHTSQPSLSRQIRDLEQEVGVQLMHRSAHGVELTSAEVYTSTRGIMMLPAYTKRYLPEQITTRPVQGEAPTLDLVLAYHKANNSPILKLLLSRVGKLAGSS